MLNTLSTKDIYFCPLKETPEETKAIDSAFNTLITTYLDSAHRRKVELISRAFNLARKVHAGRRRLNGEPFIMHPLAVAQSMAQELGLGSTSICAALLHEVLRESDYTEEDLERTFTPSIARIVAGVHKISGGIFGDRASVEAEKFKRLLLSMSTDVRVVLVKMADRLHNMRTLDCLRKEKQSKICRETLFVYAPLAERLGLFPIKQEFEEIAFRHEFPDEYTDIVRRLEGSTEELSRITSRFMQPIIRELDAAGFSYTVKSRVKSPYSIYNKMKKKNIPFEEIFDIYAVRIIFDNDYDDAEATRCRQIYNIVASMYPVHADRLRDWTETPKANGYRALHTTVLGPDNRWVEVQIRSRKMDEIAELGYAAHWKYKAPGERADSPAFESLMKTVKDILEHPEPDAMDFLDTIRLNLFASEIYVLTPAGDVVRLPSGATVLDLAFAIHSDLGMHCIAGKIDHRLVPLSHPLNSGDRVEIISSNSQRARPEWLNFCRSAKARSALRTHLK